MEHFQNRYSKRLFIQVCANIIPPMISHFNCLKVLLSLPLLGVFFPPFGSSPSLTLWISSFQDQSYYEQMADLYLKKTGKS